MRQDTPHPIYKNRAEILRLMPVKSLAPLLTVAVQRILDESDRPRWPVESHRPQPTCLRAACSPERNGAA